MVFTARSAREYVDSGVRSKLVVVDPSLAHLIEQFGPFLTAAQLLTVMTRQQLDVSVRSGRLTRVWYGIYAAAQPDLRGRLAALDVLMGGVNAIACLGTAAALYGFDVENSSAVHVLDPGVRMRSTKGLVVHQRRGAPLQWVSSRLATAPAWTAVEVARRLARPRALATLDAALRSTWCNRADLEEAIREQCGRRGIVAVRGLLHHADPRAESAMESEARLVMLDYGLPRPELQYLIEGRSGERWRVEFAWPDARVAAEYESVDWHAGRSAMLRDKTRFGGVQDAGWTVIPIIVDDVRRRPALLAQRIARQLGRSQTAG